MVYIESEDQGTYILLKFKTDFGPSLSLSQDTYQWSVPLGIREIEYFIVGGGGGSAGRASAGGYAATPGGGGGGGVREGTLQVGYHDLLTIKIGAGGRSVAYDAAQPYGGSRTELNNIIAYGGGTGASYMYPASSSGGSGGGGTASNSSNPRPPGIGYAGPPRQGYDGGTAIFDTVNHCGAGGGGGAGGNGRNASSLYIAGDGGPGRLCSLDGNYYGGGGGGAVTHPSGISAGSGGIGGGSAGTTNNVMQTVPGTPSTGGGCGGSSNSGAPATSIGGGSGIVIIRYVKPKLVVCENASVV